MKFQQWPKRDPDKNYFKVPNEVFHIGLSYPEISIYCYLLSIEDRETYQCYPSYKTIGKALGMSENTVSKYVRSLEEKGLIRTEPTMVRSKDGRPLNGNLLYTIRPIQAAIELFYERQFQQLEEDAARQRAAERLAELARESPLNLIAGILEGALPGALLVAGHVVVGVVSGHDHQRLEHHSVRPAVLHPGQHILQRGLRLHGPHIIAVVSSRL